MLLGIMLADLLPYSFVPLKWSQDFGRGGPSSPSTFGRTDSLGSATLQTGDDAGSITLTLG